MNSFIENINYVAGLDNLYGSGIELYKNNLSLKSVQHDIELKFSYYNNDDKKIHSIVHSEPGVLVGGINDTLLSFKTLVESSITGSEFTCTVSSGVQNFVINNIVMVNISIVSNSNIYKTYELEMKVVTAGAVTYDVFGEVKDSLKILPSLAMITSSEVDVMANVYEIKEEIVTVSENIANVTTVSDSIANVNTVGISISNVNIVGEDIANVNTVSTHISNVDTVSESITNVNTVGSNIVDVGIASTNIASINTVANAQNLADIIRVADDLNSLDVNGIADITIVANDLVLGVNSNIITVSESIDNVNIVGNDIDNINIVVTDIANVDIVSTNVNNINITANNIASINTVSSNIADVNTVSDVISNVNTVSGSIANVNTVASNIVDVNITGINIDEVITVATNINNVDTVATNVDDVNTVSSDITNVSTVATDISNVNNVGSNITDVIAVSNDIVNVSTVSDNISSVNIIASNITDVTYFADKYLGEKTVEPVVRNDGSPLEIADMYYYSNIANPSQNIMKVWSGIAWDTAYAGMQSYYTKAEVQTVLPAIGLDTTNTIAPTRVGQMKWNQADGTADLQLINGVTLQLGQENIRTIRNYTVSTITNGTLCMFDGTIGNSGRIKVKPFTAGFNEAMYLYGVATQDITSGSDGIITIEGKVRGVDTTGASVGEIWADEDILYAKPNDNGRMTNVMPADNELKIVVATVIHAHTSGTLEIRFTPFNENMYYTKVQNDILLGNKVPLNSDFILDLGEI